MSCCIGFKRNKQSYSFHSPYEQTSGTYRVGGREAVHQWDAVDAAAAENGVSIEQSSNGAVKVRETREYQSTSHDDVVYKKETKTSEYHHEKPSTSHTSEHRDKDTASIHSSEKGDKDKDSIHSNKSSHSHSDKKDKDKDSHHSDHGSHHSDKEERDKISHHSSEHEDRGSIHSHGSEHKAETASVKSDRDNISHHSDIVIETGGGQVRSQDERGVSEVVETLEKVQAQPPEDSDVPRAEELHDEVVQTIEETVEAPPKLPVPEINVMGAEGGDNESQQEVVITETEEIHVEILSKDAGSSEEHDNEENEGRTSVEVNMPPEMDEYEMRSLRDDGNVVHVKTTPVEMVY